MVFHVHPWEMAYPYRDNTPHAQQILFKLCIAYSIFNHVLLHTDMSQTHKFISYKTQQCKILAML